jgi:hypothetical protein
VKALNRRQENLAVRGESWQSGAKKSFVGSVKPLNHLAFLLASRLLYRRQADTVA